MKYVIFVLALLIGSMCIAQSARVIALSDGDAANLKAKWDALKLAEKNWADAQEEVKAKYLTVPYQDPEAGYEYNPPTANGVSFASTTSSCWTYAENGRMVETEDCKKEQAAERERQKKARYNRRGWEYGFEFTGDFRYIVPKVAPVTSCPSGALCSPYLYTYPSSSGQTTLQLNAN